MPASPLVTEMAFSVQFPKLSNITVLDAANLYEKFRDRFPLLQQATRAAPIRIPVEPMTQIEFTAADNRLPRLWMVTSDSKRLIQFQDDRISFNWRRVEPFGEEVSYPGFIPLKAEFLSIYTEIEQWCSERLNDKPRPEMGELFYINTIPLKTEGGTRRLSEIFRFFTPPRKKTIKGFRMAWAEDVAGESPGVVTVEASAGALPDGIAAAQLSLVSKVNLAGIAAEPEKWFEDAHTQTLEIFREAIISVSDDESAS